MNILEMIKNLPKNLDAVKKGAKKRKNTLEEAIRQMRGGNRNKLKIK